MISELSRIEKDLEKLTMELRYLHTKAFACRIEEEIHRSERYNHFFTVVLIQATGIDSGHLFRTIKDNLRFSDFTVLLPHNYGSALLLTKNGNPNEIGILLAETGADGAEAAIKKLSGAVVEKKRIKWGYAVFPDDSRKPQGLLNMARDRAERFKNDRTTSS